MANDVIEVIGVAKHFGQTHAVDGVDFTVEEGELFGLIGHNGAGKTTLFKMLLGLIEPTQGVIRIEGQTLRGEAFRQVRRRIGYVPESVAFYDHLNGIETIELFAKLKGVQRSQCEALLKRVGLGAAAHRQVQGYSKGMRQRLAFAQALLGNPKILFLDEPTNGLDPQGIQEFYSMLRELRAQGTTVVLTSHILAEIQQRVDRLALMRAGKIQALGTVHSLREALALPLGIEVKLRPGAQAAIWSVIRPLATGEIRANGQSAEFQCARENKMPVLNALSQLNNEVLDIQVREPSLEDVFMGYREAR